MQTVFFLGAGASAADGAPLQHTLFSDYFEDLHAEAPESEMAREVASFFRTMFGVDVTGPDLSADRFPTFEEALGLLDLAVQRRESFQGLPIRMTGTEADRVDRVRKHLVLLMAKVIADRLERGGGGHRRLIENLSSGGTLPSTAFLTTNYDILIDNALAAVYPEIAIDYGVRFQNFEWMEPDWEEPPRGAIPLLKLHGSLNWLSCSTCRDVTLTPREKGVIRLLTTPEETTCRNCGSRQGPLIVPPTFFKDMTNLHLANVWDRAERLLRRASRIVFCGYSFPDADLHVKYLLKRAQTNHEGEGFDVVVCNEHPDKPETARQLESQRFQRFLGNHIKITELGFDDVAATPTRVLRSPVPSDGT